MTSRPLPLALALMLLAGCADETAAPSAEQDRELNGAAEMLNEAPASLANVDDSTLRSAQEAEELSENALEDRP